MGRWVDMFGSGGKYAGSVDLWSDGQVVGWMWAKSRPDEPLAVQLHFRSGAVETVTADVFREDLRAAGIGNGAHGFHVDLGPDRLYQLSSIRSMDGKFVLNPPEDQARASDPGPPSPAVAEATADETDPEAEQPPEGDPDPVQARPPAPPLAPPPPPNTHHSSVAFGMIEHVMEDRIVGWLFNPFAAPPVLLVDGMPVPVLSWPTPREDVGAAIGSATATGFAFAVTGLTRESQIQLYTQIGDTLELVAERAAGTAYLERITLKQIYRALPVSRQKGAVAITCWEGAHNPIGRAKALYDVLAPHRPVVLLAYIFGDFGPDIWPPLSDSNAVVVTIPWYDREIYHQVLADLGMRFDLVWMCKNRLPTFELTRAIAAPDARLVLDFDDNEAHFSQSIGSREKAYGASTAGLVQALTRQVTARTAASATLQRDFGGAMVRHARQPEKPLRARNSRRGVFGVFHVGFIGTVRPHKRILEAANAIRLFSWTQKLQVVFHVAGDIQPPGLQEQLEAAGAVVRHTVPQSALRASLAEMDVILTGFPGQDADAAVVKYQITSKIGDALSVNRPVLVPRAPSVEDIADVPGVFLFDDRDFTTQLHAAFKFSGRVTLPEAFTLEGAYQGFLKAEAEAQGAPRAAEALAHLGQAPESSVPVPTLLLIWKQNDAGLYGRRVDQIARSYRQAHPDHRVIVLEFISRSMQERQERHRQMHLADGAMTVAMTALKRHGGYRDADGVEYRALYRDEETDPGLAFYDLVLQERLYPDTTLVTLFPIIEVMPWLDGALAPYRKVIDIVDNQFSWSTSESRSRLAQQYALLLKGGDRVVFNSERNHAFFQKLGYLPETTPVQITPNWYSLPKGTDLPPRAQGDGRFNILYSGNMNDRIDWLLVRTIAGLSDRVRLHLVGAADRAGPAFFEALEHPNMLYHGPKSEVETLALLARMDLTIMPHLTDKVSMYMNPLKLHMYRAVGVPTVAMAVPGISPAPGLTICDDAEAVVAAVRAQMDQPMDHATLRAETADADGGAAYVTMLDALRKAADPAD